MNAVIKSRTPEGNRRRLRKIMDEYDLGAEEVAAMLRCARGTIYAWRIGRNPMPSWAMDLLELKLLQREGAT